MLPDAEGPPEGLVAGDALGFALPIAACATRLQRSKSAWVGVAVWPWARPARATSAAIETTGAMRFVVNIVRVLRGVCGNVVSMSAGLRFKPGARHTARTTTS
jgi:hypothetical protein